MRKNKALDKNIIEICFDNTKQVVSMETLSNTIPTVTRVTVGMSHSFAKPGIMEGFLPAMGNIDLIILPYNFPTEMSVLLFPLMQLEGVEYVYVKEGETALGKGYYDMNMSYLPQESKVPVPTDPNAGIDDGFRPFPGQTGTEDPWDGLHQLKPAQGSIDDIADGFIDADKIPVDKRDMWTENPERMQRIGYIPLAAARGEHEFPPELGGGRTGL